MKKLIDIPQDVADNLSVQAIKSGKRNLKNYIESLLNSIGRTETPIIIGDGERHVKELIK